MIINNNVLFEPHTIDTWGYLNKGWQLYAYAVVTVTKKIPPAFLTAVLTAGCGYSATICLKSAREEFRKPDRDWNTVFVRSAIGLANAASAGFCLALTIGLVSDAVFSAI